MEFSSSDIDDDSADEAAANSGKVGVRGGGEVGGSCLGIPRFLNDYTVSDLLMTCI